METKIFFLDAYALIFRSYYAFIKNPRVNSKGMNTSAIFGFVNTLEDIIRRESPTHVGVVFDPPLSDNFRRKLYPDYKANREATPEDIVMSVPIIKDIVAAYNIPVIEVNGFEADDVIGTLAKRFSAYGQVFMMTPDKDYCQLVSDKVFVYKPARSGNAAEIIGVDEVRQKYGIEQPHQVIDILALWGDVSDNVPGVPGIGEKTASKLIQRFGSVNNILANVDSLQGKQKESLINNRKQLLLSQKLVTIDVDVPLTISLDELKFSLPNYSRLIRMFGELEFYTIKKRLSERAEASNTLFAAASKPSEPVSPPPQMQADLFSQGELPAVDLYPDIDKYDPQTKKYTLIEGYEAAVTLAERLSNAAEICIDTETTDLNTFNAEIIGMSVAVVPNEAFYVAMPNDHDETKRILSLFEPLLNDPNKLIIGQNLKYDLAVLSNYDITVAAPLFDTMIAHYLLEPEQKHNLEMLSAKYLKYSMIPIENLIGAKSGKQRNMQNVDKQTVSVYSCEDADVTLQLKNVFAKAIQQQNLGMLFNEVEMPLLRVLLKMERTGVCIDTEAITAYSAELKAELSDIVERIYELAGERFNVASPKQLGEILFSKLKIVTKSKTTKKGNFSTSEAELLKIKDKHEIVGQILDYRTVNKLVNSYVDVLPTLINPLTGRIHTSFNQAVTATGRLSSNSPNLQNIPIREERGRRVRACFVPSPGNTFFSADYSQIELRLMAHLSNDENMLAAFNKYSIDIHTATAAKIFHVPEADVSREMRAKAKTANFGIIYGISAFGLGQRLQIPPKEAKKIIDSYFESFPAVKEFVQKAIDFARQHEYVETIFGRRRYLPDINSHNAIVRGYAERNAVNAPIQGSAADIIKLAMVNIDKRLTINGLQAKMILQVHDELNFDVPLDELPQLQQIVVDEMQNVVKLKVPLIVDYNHGKNWLIAH